MNTGVMPLVRDSRMYDVTNSPSGSHVVQPSAGPPARYWYRYAKGAVSRIAAAPPGAEAMPSSSVAGSPAGNGASPSRPAGRSSSARMAAASTSTPAAAPHLSPRFETECTRY